MNTLLPLWEPVRERYRLRTSEALRNLVRCRPTLGEHTKRELCRMADVLDAHDFGTFADLERALVGPAIED